MISLETCERCACFAPLQESKQKYAVVFGTCKRRPPVYIGSQESYEEAGSDSIHWQQPVVRSDGGCYDFVQQQEAKP